MKTVAVADGPAFRPRSADSEPQKLVHGGPVCGHLFWAARGAGRTGSGGPFHIIRNRPVGTLKTDRSTGRQRRDVTVRMPESKYSFGCKAAGRE